MRMQFCHYDNRLHSPLPLRLEAIEHNSKLPIGEDDKVPTLYDLIYSIHGHLLDLSATHITQVGMACNSYEEEQEVAKHA